METAEKLSVRGRFVKSLISAAVVLIACVSYFVAVYVYYRNAYPSALALLFSRDMLLTFLLIAIIWSTAEMSLKLNEVYRSRPYSYILILHVLENIIGVACYCAWSSLGYRTTGVWCWPCFGVFP